MRFIALNYSGWKQRMTASKFTSLPVNLFAPLGSIIVDNFWSQDDQWVSWYLLLTLYVEDGFHYRHFQHYFFSIWIKNFVEFGETPYYFTILNNLSDICRSSSTKSCTYFFLIMASVVTVIGGPPAWIFSHEFTWIHGTRS